MGLGRSRLPAPDTSVLFKRITLLLAALLYDHKVAPFILAGFPLDIKGQLPAGFLGAGDGIALFLLVQIIFVSSLVNMGDDDS
jgi:hypothetical protein